MKPKIRRRRRQREHQKCNRFDEENTNFERKGHLLYSFLCRRCKNTTQHFMEDVNNPRRNFLSLSKLKPRVNGRNIVGCYMLRPFAHPVACCWMLLRVVAQSLKSVKLFSQQLPTFLLFCDRRSVAQQCWIHLHSSSNIVGATHAHYAWITKTYELYSSHDALQVPNLLAVVASVCTRNNVGSCCARLHVALDMVLRNLSPREFGYICWMRIEKMQ